MGIIVPNMGTILTNDYSSPSCALFSQVQRRVLALIFGNPDRSFYTREILKSVASGSGAVERELTKLERSGLVSIERIGNQKHYRANTESPIFEELRGLVKKTVGLVDPVRDALEPFAEMIEVAFIFGSTAKGTDTAHSDIDLMVIGENLDLSGLYSAAQTVENRLGRKVSAVFLSPQDWARKAADKKSFISKIAFQPKIFIMGSEKVLQGWASRNSTTS